MSKHQTIKDNSLIASSADISESAKVINSKVGVFCQLFEDSMLCYSQLGDYSYLSRRSSAFSSVIGKYCSISWNVSIGPAVHDYKRVTQHAMLYASRFGMIDSAQQRYYDQYKDETTIGNDVWIGCNAVIMRGVHIGDGAVVGANSVITKDVAPYAIMGGINRLIKFRFSDEVIQSLLDLRWWDYPHEFIKQNISLLACEPTIAILKQIKELSKDTK